MVPGSAVASPATLPFGPAPLVHDLFAAIGVLVGAWVFVLQIRYRRRATGRPVDDRIWTVVAGALVGGALLGRLGTWAQHFDLRANAGLVEQWLYGNRSILSGVVGAYFGALLAKRLTGYRDKTGDLFAPAVAAGMAVGRIGCLLTELPGTPTGFAWGVTAWDTIPRHPSFAYEIAFHTAAFLILLRLRPLLLPTPLATAPLSDPVPPLAAARRAGPDWTVSTTGVAGVESRDANAAGDSPSSSTAEESASSTGKNHLAPQAFLDAATAVSPDRASAAELGRSHEGAYSSAEGQAMPGLAHGGEPGADRADTSGAWRATTRGSKPTPGTDASGARPDRAHRSEPGVGRADNSEAWPDSAHGGELWPGQARAGESGQGQSRMREADRAYASELGAGGAHADEPGTEHARASDCRPDRANPNEARADRAGASECRPDQADPGEPGAGCAGASESVRGGGTGLDGLGDEAWQGVHVPPGEVGREAAARSGGVMVAGGVRWQSLGPQQVYTTTDWAASRYPQGILFNGFVVAYGVFRFAVEFVRGNEVVFAGLTRPQWFLLGVAPLVVWRVGRIVRRAREGVA